MGGNTSQEPSQRTSSVVPEAATVACEARISEKSPHLATFELPEENIPIKTGFPDRAHEPFSAAGSLSNIQHSLMEWICKKSIRSLLLME
ncbi:hypothetical protein CEXT_662621 [Caerostris extrusa]|uniref:Uncharacterized protein n=1 Tax=Caerostris extrusa TaxID=172846 RepID=A0AAV4VC29_CAEEX|nr:hypothetical protein CEXT_662621 [Caerostris extrusa]